MSRILMRFPNGRPRALTLSYDDGVEQDRRLIEIMQKHGLKGTFNINSGLYAPKDTIYTQDQLHRRMTQAQATSLYENSQMEVAAHSLTHPFLEQLPIAGATYEIIRDRENLERQFHTIVRGMAYPYGTYNDAVVAALQSCGIAYARTIESSKSFKMPSDWLRLQPTCHHDDAECMKLLELFLSANTDRAPLLFYLWGHSYEFELCNNWHKIEEFAQKAGGHTDVWYATNIELCDYASAFQQLRFCIDGTRVFNPTATALWFTNGESTYRVQPGQELMI